MLTALFPPGKGGGDKVDHGYKGKGITTHILVDNNGMPLAARTTPASSSEQNEVIDLLESARVPNPKGGRPKSCPKELQADRGYDSQKLREQIRSKGVRPIIPRRIWKGRKKRRGRKPPACKDRFKVERFFSWLQRKYRRLCIKWERRALYYDAFLNLAIIMIWTNLLCKSDIVFG